MTQPNQRIGERHQTLLKQLSIHQRAAVLLEDGGLRNGVILVDAGPGSGKTRVLATRVAHLLACDVPKSQILCVTYNKKATEEMKDRIKRYASGVVPDVTTFNALARQIFVEDYRLRKGPRAKLPFMQLGPGQIKKALDVACAKHGMVTEAQQRKFATYITRAKNRGEKSVADFNPEGIPEEDVDLARLIWQTYEQFCKEGPIRRIDFDDQLNLGAHVLRTNEALRRMYHERWHHILGDEFQDANKVQYAMLRMIAENRVVEENNEPCRFQDWRDRSLLLVADVDQSIYRFRGADYRIVAGMPRYFPVCKVVPLGLNYRCPGRIVKASAHLIANNRERTIKRLFTTNPDGPKIKVLAVNDAKDEAERVADRISKIWFSRKGVSEHQHWIAVLTRTNSQHDLFVEALRKRGIPAVKKDSAEWDNEVDITHHAEMRTVIGMLKIGAHGHTDLNVGSILSTLGSDTANRVRRLAKQYGITLWESLRNTETSEVRALRKSVGLVCDAIRDERPAQAFALALNSTGWIERLITDGDEEQQSRLRVLTEHIIRVANFHQAGFSIESMLRALEGNIQSVDLLTAHAAKGLEYEHVFIAGLEEGVFPNGEDDIEEERRLLYVAMTRAFGDLTISYSKDAPSRFLTELPEDTLERLPGVNGRKTAASTRQPGQGK